MLLGDINVRSHHLDDFTGGVERRPTNTMNVLDGLVREYDAEINFGTGLLPNAPLSGLIKLLHIIGMNPAASFRKGYQAACWIKAKCPVSFLRPIRDLPMNRVVRKAAAVTESLRFSQIRLASPQGVLCLFAIFNIGARAIPSHDVSLLISKWIVEGQEPAVLTVFSSNSRFRFKWNAALNPKSPALQNVG